MQRLAQEMFQSSVKPLMKTSVFYNWTLIRLAFLVSKLTYLPFYMFIDKNFAFVLQKI